MGNKDRSIVEEVRNFNRFYTNILGLLDKGILDSPYSLTEARVLFEIGSAYNCTAVELTERLDIDRGYMSRILKHFEADGMIIKENSQDDGRIVFLRLTSKGRETLSNLDEKSSNQICSLIKHLTGHEQVKLVDSMKYIMGVLTPNTDLINIRTYHQEDIKYIINIHREMYKNEYGFSAVFGDYVEKYVLKFNEEHDEAKENIWLAEVNRMPAGVIAIVKAGESLAQLRWFLVESDMRGRGLGHKLMETAINFCREKNYKQILLWTADVLEAAHHIYKGYGFTLTETIDNYTWTGNLVKEERWDLKLT